MRIVKWRPGASYVGFMQEVKEAGGLAPGTINLLNYAHDDRCPRLRGGDCRCDPEVSMTIYASGESVRR